MSNVYVLTESTKKRFEKTGLVLECRHCRRAILPGMKVVSRKNSVYGSRKLYHYSCWLKLFVEGK